MIKNPELLPGITKHPRSQSSQAFTGCDGPERPPPTPKNLKQPLSKSAVGMCGSGVLISKLVRYIQLLIGQEIQNHRRHLALNYLTNSPEIHRSSRLKCTTS